MDSSKLSHLLDLPVPVEARVQAQTLRIAELLSLDVGSLIATRIRAGENVDIFAGGAPFGSGELITNRSVVRMVTFGVRK